MTRPLTLSLLFIFALVHLSQAQCVTSGYVLCLPQGSELGGIPDVDYDDSLFWDSLQDSTIVYPAALRRDLASRQNALCCDPTNDCLITTDSNIPFCYVSAQKCSSFSYRCSSDISIRTLCANLQRKRIQTQPHILSPMVVSVSLAMELTMPLMAVLSISKTDTTRARMAQRELSPQPLRLLRQAVQELPQRVPQPLKVRALP